MARFTSEPLLFGPNGVTATTAGSANSYYDFSARHNMSLHLVAGSENAVFELQISNDGTNFVTYERLVPNQTNTNSQTDAGVGSVSVTAGTSVFYFVKLGDTFRYCRGSVTLVGTDSVFNVTMHGID